MMSYAKLAVGQTYSYRVKVVKGGSQ